MITYLKELNRKYDNLKEPNRFLWFFFVIAIPLSILMGVLPIVGAILAALFILIRQFCRYE